MKYIDVAVVIFAIALIVAFPFAIIWALNTLFGFGLAYSFANWLAVVVLKLFVFTNQVSNKKK